MENINFKNKIILLRLDFDVPIQVYDDSYYVENYHKINAVLDVIKNLITKEPKLIIIASQLGTPNGKFVNNLSLLLIRNYLSLKLNRKISFLAHYYPMIDLSAYNGIVMLENLRFLNIKENDNLVNYFCKFTDFIVDKELNCYSKNLFSKQNFVFLQ